MAESKEELKNLLMKEKEESEKAGLNLNIQKMKIMASSLITSWQTDGKKVKMVTFYFPGLQNHCRWWLQPWNEKTPTPWKKCYDQPRQHIKKQRHYFASKGLCGQSYGFSSNHVRMWELDQKQGWAEELMLLNYGAGENNLESPLDSKKIKPVNPQGNQPWIFIGRKMMLQLKLQYFSHLMQRADSLEKTLMLGKIEGRRRKGRQHH